MSREDEFIESSILTYKSGITVVTVEVQNADLEYTEFMELIEALINTSGYSQHEIENYILEWASDIKSTKEN